MWVPTGQRYSSWCKDEAISEAPVLPHRLFHPPITWLSTAHTRITSLPPRGNAGVWDDAYPDQGARNVVIAELSLQLPPLN
ncbi:hypothetical protein J6590_036826 [Homalodisca vitripennis]|nr:hypothetical protein J6590_036826 [Homalodisca vitripennis]